MMHVTYLSGRLSGGGNRHCPSVATRAPRRVPSEASTTVERGLWNEGIGAARMHRIKMAAIPVTIFTAGLKGRCKSKDQIYLF
jgi:hypothetical protein